MARLTKTKKKQGQHHIPGEGVARGLIVWLNEASREETSARLEIISLIEAGNRLLRDIPVKAEHYARRKRKPATWPAGTTVSEGKVRFATPASMYWYKDLIILNQKLREHKFFPVLEIPIGDAWKVAWKVEQDIEARRAVHEVLPDGGGRDYHTDDPKATFSAHVYVVVHLAETGCLYRVRRCRNCSTWFYAERRPQWFCKPKCWERFYFTRENIKVERRAYMRKYMAERRKRNKPSRGGA